MSLQIFPTRRIGIEEIEALPQPPWELVPASPEWVKKSYWVRLPHVARARVWTAGEKTSEGHVIAPYYAPGAVWFEIFSTNLKSDWCGPFFAELEKALGCQFVEEYGSLVTFDGGVDSDIYDDHRVDLALRAMERRPGLLKKLYDRPKGGWSE